MPPSRPTDRQQIEARVRREGRRPVDAGLFGNYRLTMLLSLAVSLAGFLALANMPWATPGGDLGWRPGRDSNPTMFQIVPRRVVENDREELAAAGAPVPATTFNLPDPNSRASTEEQAENPEPSDPGAETGSSDTRRVADMARMQVLDFAEEQPGILGGLNALYMHIRYPKAARDAGIQGQVILQFIVELDGRASNIRVLRSLHPLCDNAAIEAVKLTRFRPARQNGQLVRVRMNLPIRFVLIDESTGNVVKSDTQAVPSSFPQR